MASTQMDSQSSKANLVPGLQRVPQFQPGLTLLYKDAGRGINQEMVEDSYGDALCL